MKDTLKENCVYMSNRVNTKIYIMPFVENHSKIKLQKPRQAENIYHLIHGES